MHFAPMVQNIGAFTFFLQLLLFLTEGVSNGINGALIAQSGKVCYNIDASIRDKAFRMVFIRLSEFYQVQYITLTKGCQESFSVSLYTPLSVCYNLSWYDDLTIMLPSKIDSVLCPATRSFADRNHV